MPSGNDRGCADGTATTPIVSGRALLRRGFEARGRRFTPRQLKIIARIVSTYSQESRTRISQRICRAIRWRQPNGQLKDMACREVLRKLNEIGFIELPAPRAAGARWIRSKGRAAPVIDQSPITALRFGETTLIRVPSKSDPLASLWNSLVEHYHYLGSSRIVGRQIKYLAFLHDRPIACFGWSDAAWAVRCRDQWIGWTQQQRERNRHRVVNNARFLILPWIRVPNLASFLIARCTDAAIRDWGDIYGYRPLLLETFVDADRFTGTCYRAANWTELGQTSGYAKFGASHHNSQQPKLLLVYPTSPEFRSRLRGRMK